MTKKEEKYFNWIIGETNIFPWGKGELTAEQELSLEAQEEEQRDIDDRDFEAVKDMETLVCR